LRELKLREIVILLQGLLISTMASLLAERKILQRVSQGYKTCTLLSSCIVIELIAREGCPHKTFWSESDRASYIRLVSNVKANLFLQ